jgi:hypothetical protein
MRHGDAAWVSLACGILAYEIAAPNGELLSEAVDRYRRRHPFITNGLILYVALHLMRGIPARIDPLHQLALLHRWRP